MKVPTLQTWVNNRLGGWGSYYAKIGAVNREATFSVEGGLKGCPNAHCSHAPSWSLASPRCHPFPLAPTHIH